MANNTVHTITLSGYTATLPPDAGWALQLGTWDSYGIEQIQLALGPEWTGLVITATFTPPSGGTTTKVVVDSSGLFDVPQEATALSGHGTITFAGNTSGQQRISVDVPYVVANHAAVDGVTPDPTPSEWTQFVEQVQQARDDAESAAQAAEDSQTAAASSASEAAESADKAAQSTQEAERLVTGAVTAISIERDEAVRAVNTAGGNAVQAVNTAGNSAVQNLEQKKTEAVQAVEDAQAAGAKAVNDAGNAKIKEIEAVNSLLPKPTEADAGKVPVAQPDGSYQLGDAGNKIDDTVVAPDTTWSSLNIVNKLCPPFSVTGDAVQFSPVEGYPLSVQSTIVATQEGTGDPSPENIRPIVPVNEVSAWFGGKNLLDISTLKNSITVKGITFSPEAGGMRIAGTATGDVDSPIFALQLPPGTYVGNIKTADYPWLFSASYVVERQDGSRYYYDARNPFTVRDGEIGKYFYVVVKSGETVDALIYPQLELGTSATVYEPYRGQLYTVPLPEPCYGGTVDLTGGKFSKTFGVTVVDGTTVKFTTNAGKTYYNLPVNSSPNVSQLSTDKILSSHFPYLVWSKNGVYDFIFSTAEGMAPYFSNVDELNAYCQQQYAAGTPVTIAYPLEIAETIGINPLFIPAPASPATAYSTARDISVSGRSDPIEYVNQQIANAIAIAKV